MGRSPETAKPSVRAFLSEALPGRDSTAAVDWSSLGPAALALLGVGLGLVVGAVQRRDDRRAAADLREADAEARRREWEREHRRALYVLPLRFSARSNEPGFPRGTKS